MFFGLFLVLFNFCIMMRKLTQLILLNYFFVRILWLTLLCKQN